MTLQYRFCAEIGALMRDFLTRSAVRKGLKRPEEFCFSAGPINRPRKDLKKSRNEPDVVVTFDVMDRVCI